MALIGELKKLDQTEGQLHLPVEARYAVFTRDGKSFVQINTYGRPTREIPGKVSQSIQFDESSATQLVNILKQTFKIG